MTKITNTDSRETREAQIITLPSGSIQWCVAVWPAPEYGWSKADGNGHGWQIVRRWDDGRYTYNGEMMGGFRDSLDDVRAFAAAKGYTLI